MDLMWNSKSHVLNVWHNRTHSPDCQSPYFSLFSKTLLTSISSLDYVLIIILGDNWHFSPLAHKGLMKVISGII